MDNLIACNDRVKHKKSKSNLGRAGEEHAVTPLTTVSPLKLKVVPSHVKQKVSFEVLKLTSFLKGADKFFTTKLCTSEGEWILEIRPWPLQHEDR